MVHRNTGQHCTKGRQVDIAKWHDWQGPLYSNMAKLGCPLLSLYDQPISSPTDWLNWMKIFYHSQMSTCPGGKCQSALVLQCDHWQCVQCVGSSGPHTTMTRLLGWCLAAALLQAATPAKFFRTKFSNCGECRLSPPHSTLSNFSSPAAGLFRI